LVEHMPLLLHEPIQHAPDWALPIVSLLVFGLLIYLALEFFQRAVAGLRWLCRLVTNPIAAGKQAAITGRPATQEDVLKATSSNDQQLAEILAELRALRAKEQAQGEAQPVDAAEEQRTAEAVRDVLADSGLSARAAADAMREGRVTEAFRILRRDAAAGEAETAERWLRLGALARGIDTRQALEAYEAAFRIQPSDFVTCIELPRLRMQAGDLAGAEQAALAAQSAAASDREAAISASKNADIAVEQGNLTTAVSKYQESQNTLQSLGNSSDFETQRDLSVSHNKIGDVQVAQGDLGAALESFKAGLAIREQLAALDPGNAGWQRDLIVSYAKLAGMQPGAGWWAKGLAVAEKLAAEGRLAPVDM